MKIPLKNLFALYIAGICSLNGTTLFVSTSGSDQSGDGSIVKPFKSIQKAVDSADTGDVIQIREGIYREKISLNKDSLTLTNHENEFVVISGAEKVIGWTLDSGNLYKAYFDSNRIDQELEFTMLISGGVLQPPARHPNDDGDRFTSIEWIQTVNSDDNNGVATVTFAESYPDNYWNGAYYMGVNTSNGNSFQPAKGQVVSSVGNVLKCNRLNRNWRDGWKSSVGPGRGYLIFHKNACDSFGEWHFERAENSLFYYAPAAIDPNNQNIEIRTRLWVLDFNGFNNITLEGLNFRAGLVDMADTSGSIVDNCHFMYLSPLSGYNEHAYGQKEDGSQGIYVSGSNNIIRNSYFGSSWHGMITLYGTNNIVENCLLEDGNWSGQRMAPISIYGDGNILRGSTIRRAGRGAVDGGNHIWIKTYGVNSVIEYNHFYDVMLLSTDGGAFYTNLKHNPNPPDPDGDNGQSPFANLKIHHNWISTGKKGSHYGHIRAGIYLDDNTSGAWLYNNVVYDSYEGIRTNQDNLNVIIYNNTVINHHDETHARWDKGGAEITTQNNISILDDGWKGTTINSNNVHVSESDFVDWKSMDFRLVADSAAIDAGTVIPGMVEEFSGAAPDCGAYEFGENWVAGADWDVKGILDVPGHGFRSSGPRELSAGKGLDGLVTLTWEDHNESETGYLIYRSRDESQMEVIADLKTPNLETFKDFSSVPQVGYYYRVQAYKDELLSAGSNEIFIKLAPDSVSSLRDDMDDLSKMIESSNIRIINWNSQSIVNSTFLGDNARARRETLTDGFGIWQVNDIRSFEARIFFFNGDDEVRFFVSEKGINYTQILPENPQGLTTTTGSWRTGIFTANLSNTQKTWNYLKIVFVGNEEITGPQLGYIKINDPDSVETLVPGQTYVDSLDNDAAISIKSENWGLLTDNIELFKDSSRLARTSNVDGFVQWETAESQSFNIVLIARSPITQDIIVSVSHDGTIFSEIDTQPSMKLLNKDWAVLELSGEYLAKFQHIRVSISGGTDSSNATDLQIGELRCFSGPRIYSDSMTYDSDNDFLPDVYEEMNGLDKYVPINTTLDTDDDGQADFFEMLAGTDHRSAVSRFDLFAGSYRDVGVALSFPTFVGRQYQVFRSEGTPNPMIFSLFKTITGAGNQFECLIDNTSGHQVFYYIKPVIMIP